MNCDTKTSFLPIRCLADKSENSLKIFKCSK